MGRRSRNRRRSPRNQKKKVSVVYGDNIFVFGSFCLFVFCLFFFWPLSGRPVRSGFVARCRNVCSLATGFFGRLVFYRVLFVLLFFLLLFFMFRFGFASASGFYFSSLVNQSPNGVEMTFIGCRLDLHWIEDWVLHEVEKRLVSAS